MKDKNRDNPLKILFRRVQFMLCHNAKSERDDTRLQINSLLWKKLQIVVKATYCAIHCKEESETSISLLHAIVDCGGHPRVVEHVIQENPNDVLRRDDNGRVPLTIAAAKVSTHPDIIKMLIRSNQNTAIMADSRGRLPLHLAVESGLTVKSGVRLIAQAAPAALQTRDVVTGMYPFMLAAIPSYRWDNTCIETIYSLLRSAPHVLMDALL